jgi:preprotein translocase subunit SecG
METVLLSLLVFAGFGLIILVLLQQGKGADAGAAFGGGGGGGGASGSVFGAQGSGSFMTKTTGVFATIFFLCSLSLAYLSGKAINNQESIVDSVVTTQEEADTTADQMPGTQTEADVPVIPTDEVAIPAGDAGADQAPKQ